MDPNQKYSALRDSKGGVKQCVVSGVFLAVACIFTGLRIWARALLRRKLAFNDYACIVALVICFGLTAIIFTSAIWAGAGHHASEIDPQYAARIYVIFAAGQPVWGAANTAVKFSILHLYTTIFPLGTFRKWCWVVMGISMCYLASVVLETFLMCKPVAFNWDKTIPTGTCDKNSNIAYIVAAATNVVIDVVIVVMPMPMLWQLQLPFSKKIGVIAMFSLGAGICIISILRTVYVAKMDLTDFAYASSDLAIWSVLEPTLGIVNACLPVLRPVMLKLMGSPAVAWARQSLRSGSKSTSQDSGLTYDKNKRSSRKDAGSNNTEDSKNRKKIRDPYALDTINLVDNNPQRSFELTDLSGSGAEAYEDSIGSEHRKTNTDIRATTD